MNGSSSNASSWLNWAQQPREAGGLGLAPHQAAGLVGNLQSESGPDLPAWGPTGDNRTAWGTAQWRNERLASLKQMFPDSYQTTESQQAFMRHEMDTTHNGAYQALLAAKTPEEAAAAVNRRYEISADTTGGRERNARALMAQFDGGGAPDTGGALSFASTNTPTSKSSMPTPALSADQTVGQGALAQPPEDRNDRFYQGMMGAAAALAGISNPSQANSLTQSGLAMRKQKGAYSYQVLPNGQLMVTNSAGGAPQIMGKAGDYSKDDTFSPVMGKDDAGNPTFQGTFNKNTGEYKSVNGGAQQPPQPEPTTPEELAAIDPARAQAAKDVYEGRVDLPKGSRLNAVQNRLRKDVLGVYKDIDENKLSARRQFLTDDAKSAPQSFGGQLQKTNTALGLLEDVADHYGTMGNTRSAFGSGVAKVENYLAPSSFGDTQGSLRQKLDVSAQNAAADINSLQNAGRGSVGEREHIKEGLFLPYSSPREQAGALQGHIDTLSKAVDAKFEHEAKQMGQGYVENDPRYQDYKRRLAILQDKADKLYNGDFSYAKGGDKPAAGLKSAAPAIDHDALAAELKRRGL